MSGKLGTYKFDVATNAGSNFVCILPGLNYMDAVNKFSTQGFAVSMEGRIVLTTAINDFSVSKIDEGIEPYKVFADANAELLKGLRLM